MAYIVATDPMAVYSKASSQNIKSAWIQNRMWFLIEQRVLCVDRVQTYKKSVLEYASLSFSNPRSNSADCCVQVVGERSQSRATAGSEAHARMQLAQQAALADSRTHGAAHTSSLMPGCCVVSVILCHSVIRAYTHTQSSLLASLCVKRVQLFSRVPRLIGLWVVTMW